ncbi:MAG: hypothetical protein HWD86_04810 [Kangiellaceae bacterium]|nr:hypothetical protein [Kangiellaceae bacterium]
MTIHIHHGPNGGYKSSHCVKHYVRQCAYEGRTLITNLRACNNPALIRALIAIHEKGSITKPFDIIHLDTETSDTDLYKMRTFFHWAPKGAFILIDEASDIFPKSMTAKELQQFNLPREHDRYEGRYPKTVAQAFKKHRHQGWDIALSEPDITTIHDVIRSTTEDAYRHANMAFIGFAGFYQTINHSGKNTGEFERNQMALKRWQKIPKHVYQMYQSTADGVVKDSSAGTPIWKNPQILFAFFILVSFFIYMGGKYATGRGYSRFYDKETQATNTSDQVVSKVGSSEISNVSNRSFSNQNDVGNHPLASYKLSITGVTYFKRKFEYFFELRSGDNDYSFSHNDFISMGYKVTPRNDCRATILYGSTTFDVYCSPRLIPKVTQGLTQPQDITSQAIDYGTNSL